MADEPENKKECGRTSVGQCLTMGLNCHKDLASKLKSVAAKYSALVCLQSGLLHR